MPSGSQEPAARPGCHPRWASKHSSSSLCGSRKTEAECSSWPTYRTPSDQLINPCTGLLTFVRTCFHWDCNDSSLICETANVPAILQLCIIDHVLFWEMNLEHHEHVIYRQLTPLPPPPPSSDFSNHIRVKPASVKWNLTLASHSWSWCAGHLSWTG